MNGWDSERYVPLKRARYPEKKTPSPIEVVRGYVYDSDLRLIRICFCVFELAIASCTSLVPFVIGINRGLSISHFGVFSENAEEAFVCAFEDVIWHVIVEIGPKSLGDETLAIDLVEEIADAVGCVGGAAVPGLAAEEVEVSRFHVQGFGTLAVEGWIFWIVGLPACVVAAGYELAGAILVFILLCQGDLE